MADMIHLGFEVGTGLPVSIPIHHLAVTGQTRLSGKTTTIEALLSRLPEAYHALLFSTKRGELAFASVPRVEPFYRQHTNWEYVESLLEAAMKERMRITRSFIINACIGTNTLRQVYNNIIKSRKEARRGFDEAMFTNLQAYFEKVLPQLEANPFAGSLPLAPGPNVMDLGHLSEEVQALVIAACLEEIHAHASKTIVVIPEAWKFIPQSRGNPVKWAAEHVVREGGASQLWLWFDAQDITGMDKQPLKSVGVWLLGRQMEVNEVKRVLAQVPSSKKPKPEDVARLPIGQFFTAAEDWCRAVYAQPAWLDEEAAKKVAMGEAPVPRPPAPAEVVPVLLNIPQPISNTLTGQLQKMPNCPEEEDPTVIAELQEQLARTEKQRDEFERELGQLHQDLATERIAGERTREDKAVIRKDLEKALQELSRFEGQDVAIERLRDTIREFLWGLGFELQASAPQVAPDASLDLDALAQKVADRLGTGRPLVQLVPMEALKHRFQQEAVDRLVAQVRALEERPRQAVLWLLSVGRPAKHMEICRRLAFPEAGASFAKFGTGIKRAVEVGVLVVEPDGLRVTLREKVTDELAPYGSSPADIEATYQHVVAALVNGADKQKEFHAS